MHTLFCVLPYRAGVYQNRIGLFDAPGQFKSGFGKRSSHKRTIQLVHLTPVGLKVHLHRAPPNLDTPVPAFRFAGANLRGQPKLFMCTVLVVIAKREYIASAHLNQRNRAALRKMMRHNEQHHQIH